MDESDRNPTLMGFFNRFQRFHSGHSLVNENENEKLLLNKLQGLVTNIKWSPKNAGDLFDALLKRFLSTTIDRSCLISWMMEMLHCIEINHITPSWKCGNETGETLIELVQDKTITDGNIKTRLADDKEKKLYEILEEIRQEKLNQIDDKLLEEVRDIVSSVNKDLNSQTDVSQQCGLKKDLLSICQAVKKNAKFRPHLTQMVSWCIMALSETGRLVQVGTGEGKSCIVAMFAAFRVLRGEKVDIMSSSPVLAERDSQEWGEFYKTLNISVSCNINKQDEDLKKCYECQVVYGTVENFAGHWLQQHFLRKDIFGERKFQCAIVDEVDSLMLDKGHHVVYISSDMPALQHLNPLLALIWATVNQYSNTDSETAGEESVLRAVETQIKRSLYFTPCEISKDKSRCYVPGFLSDLVKAKLNVWIQNAFRAKTMAEDHEYVIEKHGIVPVDYSCTGVVENFMTMSDGLQQFLEMKHESKMSNMTAITNYMSNVGLLQKYGHQIFGISGTLGQQEETETLKKIYEGIKTCQIPSFKRRKLFEVEGVVLKDEVEWTKKICDIVTEQTKPTLYRKERAVLIICETIKRAKDLHKTLGDNVPNKKLYTSNNMDNTAIIKEKLKAGAVIIATNLAGRGTDLQVSENVKTAGGLFVMQTFLPKNARVEAQVFGRTARQGSPGSAQLIVCSRHLSAPLQFLVLMKKFLSLLENVTDDQRLFVNQLTLYQRPHINEQLIDMYSTLSNILTENSKSEIKIAKEVRDDQVAEELDHYLKYEIPKIKKKAELFNQYLQTLDDVYKTSNNKPADSELSALNEFWGLWLLKDFTEDDSVEELKSKLKTDLDRARQSLRQRDSPSSNLHHYTVFGNELRKKGHLAESIKMYRKAIQEDPCWAAIAYYNRAFATLTLQGKYQDRSCIDQALQDLQNSLKSVELYCQQIEVTHRYSSSQIREHQSDRFDRHVITKYRVLLFFKANINEAIKTLEKTRELDGNVKVKENLIYFLVPLRDYLSLVGLSKEFVTAIRSRDPLRIQQTISQPSFDLLNELTCLESLGLPHFYTLNTWFGILTMMQRGIRRASRWLSHKFTNNHTSSS